jgi:hypothetical protein
MEEEESYINKYELRNKKTGKLFTDLLEVIILELPKLPEKTDGQGAWRRVEPGSYLPGAPTDPDVPN